MPDSNGAASITTVAQKNMFSMFYKQLARFFSWPYGLKINGSAVYYEKQMLKLFLCCSILIASLWGCTQNEPDLLAQGISFDVFYERFLTDSAYQLEHISFPIEGLPANPDIDINDFYWQKSDWQIQQKIDAETTGFLSRFEHVSDGFVIEIIQHKSGKYAMERRFARLSENQWKLIYYAALHPISSTG